jgi:Cytochrome P460
MNNVMTAAVAVSAVFGLASSAVSGEEPPAFPTYTSDGGLKIPEHYREWVYLSTGFDMSYRLRMQAGHHMFDNVFVNPESYRWFLKTGTWPDKTMLVLEERRARGRGSINRTGNYQDREVMGLEVHLKDQTRFHHGWAFFAFEGDAVGKLLPPTADCYSCHAAHAAVDTTFVQFYPTLLPLATSKRTLSPAYLAEEAAASPTTPPRTPPRKDSPSK